MLDLTLVEIIVSACSSSALRGTWSFDARPGKLLDAKAARFAIT
jgi:hypothetical protein